MTKVCLVAAPLTARSGVYRSSRELVTEARRMGLDWSLELGVSRSAGGSAPVNDPEWITESASEPAGYKGLEQLSEGILQSPNARAADVIVSLIPQTDMALARTDSIWFAYVRGLPWPDRGEASTARRLVWRFLERRALSRATGVWATTRLLKGQLALKSDVRLVPAGLASVQRRWDGAGTRNKVVWAARFDEDKNPWLFLEAMRNLPLSGVMYGSGPLEDEIRRLAPPNVTVAGWVDPAELWDDALAYVGTSHREAFGRSAVEAAMSGIPVVLADTFGSADLLLRDAAMASRFVLPLGDSAKWSTALMTLFDDEALRREVSDYVCLTGNELTVERSVYAIESALESAASAH